ncbi:MULTISPECIES: HEPN domain-containing protein [Metallosphaera]|uniref:HEPN domain protein n=3 Tax=Metallosphaera TaxID=41980 RepID=A4YG84_METS5|nr:MULTISPECIES: HEPN domain-containing protein [Metallosphaera]ABP95436.1 HEPN domain protein [Metallosphaera sedula DSM 5348]AIM27421.1 HEPN domain protein [Metallosphaera sedula]AKV74295.1 DNA-binding protein [Metallosphaera sedula]AKV76534.1 DNA-binding protein [Metallosphaera sedula]AKV78786.1 DNA-binding protein [Metallosphaera sedula]
MSGVKVQTLKRRALQFLKDARRDLNEGIYDLAVFYAEQAIQLYVKAILFEMFASEIKSHEIRSLISSLSKLLRENGYQNLANDLDNLVKKFRKELIDLEVAYIDSRYEDIEYDKETTEEILNVAMNIINELEEISKNVKLGKG